MSNETHRRGRPPSPNKMVRILLNLPAPMVAALDRIAANTFERRATVIRWALARAIKSSKG